MSREQGQRQVSWFQVPASTVRISEEDGMGVTTCHNAVVSHELMRHARVTHLDARRLGAPDLVARWIGIDRDQVISGTPAHAAPSPSIPTRLGGLHKPFGSLPTIPLCPSWPGGEIGGAGNQVECFATQQGWQPTLQKDTGGAQKPRLSLLRSRYGCACIFEPRASLSRGRSARLQ